MKTKLWDYLTEQYVGKDPNYKKVGDDIFKTIKEGYCEKLGYVPLKPMALAMAVDPGSPVLKAISCSHPDDILTNIFGATLSAILSSGNNEVRNLQDDTGVVRSLNINRSGSTYNTTQVSPTIRSLGSQLQIGSGGGPGDRTDFQIAAPFTVAPESLPFNLTTAGWIASSQEAILNGILNKVTLAGIATECGLFGRWNDFTGLARNYMLSHDDINLSFDGGENVLLTYTWSIL